MTASELVKALHFWTCDFWVDQFNNVTAAARAEIIDQLPGDVRDDVSDIFLLLPLTRFALLNGFAIDNGFFEFWLSLAYLGPGGLDGHNGCHVVGLAGDIHIGVAPHVSKHWIVLTLHLSTLYYIRNMLLTSFYSHSRLISGSENGYTGSSSAP
jgi:hypothetical protein